MLSRDKVKQNKVLDKLVDQIYRDRCSGMQISVMRIPELFEKARAMILGGFTHMEIGDWMVAFVEKEKL